MRRQGLAVETVATASPRPSEPDGTRLVPSWWGRLVRGTEHLLFDGPLWRPLLLVVVLEIAKNGVLESPAVGLWLRIARAFPGNPHLPRSTRYMQASPIGPALAHLLGIQSGAAYAWLHAGVLVVALGVLIGGLWRRGGRPAVAVGTMAFFATPLSSVLLNFGAQDPFTFLFASMAVLFESPVVALVAGAGLAASHLEVGAFCLAVLLALQLADDTGPVSWATAGAGWAGLLGAALGVELYTRHSGAGIEARAAYIDSFGARTLVRDFLQELPTWLYTTFSAFWVFLVCLASRLRNRRLALVAGAAGLIATAATVLTYDETRVFALLTWPVVLWLSLYALRRFDPRLVRHVTAVTFLAAIVLPRITVFGGAVAGSALGFVLTKALHAL